MFPVDVNTNVRLHERFRRLILLVTKPIVQILSCKSFIIKGTQNGEQFNMQIMQITCGGGKIWNLAGYGRLQPDDHGSLDLEETRIVSS